MFVRFSLALYIYILEAILSAIEDLSIPLDRAYGVAIDISILKVHRMMEMSVGRFLLEYGVRL